MRPPLWQRLRRWFAGLVRGRDAPPTSAGDLRALAQEIEDEQPALAAELRGIALHGDAMERSSS
jgi:hypothetical protein